MARVRGVMAASIFVVSMVSPSHVGSTSTGFKPLSTMALMVAMNVLAGTITSSPSLMMPISMYALRISHKASRPLPVPMQCRVPI